MVRFWQSANPSVGLVGSFRLVGNELRPGRASLTENLLFQARKFAVPYSFTGIYPFGTSNFAIDSVRTWCGSHNPFFQRIQSSRRFRGLLRIALRSVTLDFVHQVLTFHSNSTRNSQFRFLWGKGTPFFAGNLGDLVKFGPYYCGMKNSRSTLQNRPSRITTAFWGEGFSSAGEKGFLAYHCRQIEGTGPSLKPSSRIPSGCADTLWDRVLALKLVGLMRFGSSSCR